MYDLKRSKVNKRKKGQRQGRGLVGKVLKGVTPVAISSVPTLINRAVDMLPVELHLPGYRFCGPGTKLQERLARGERGINQLDEACREHDIAYAKYKDNERRRIADRVLANKAWERAKAWNSGVSERAYAAAVAAAMKAKSAVGGGGHCCGSARKQRSTSAKKKTGSGIQRARGGKGGSGGGGSVRKRTSKRKTASGLYLRPYRKN